MTRHLVWTICLLLMLGPITALAEEVVIYTPNRPAAVAVVRDAITRETGQESRFVTGGSAVLLRRIMAEEADSKADVMWSTSISTLGSFSGLLQPYDAPALADIPAYLHGPDNLFLPANIHVVTLMVNEDELNGQAVPTSWVALADPVWRGRVVVADPANSSTGYAILYGLSRLLDVQTFRQLTANLVISETSAAVPLTVAAGRYAVGVTFEANSYAYVDAGSDRFNVIYPTEGTFITTDYAAAIKNAPAGEGAFRALDAILARETQIALLESAYRRPSRSDIQVSDYVNLPELNDIRVFPVDEAQGAIERQRFLAEWGVLPKAGGMTCEVPDGTEAGADGPFDRALGAGSEAIQ